MKLSLKIENGKIIPENRKKWEDWLAKFDGHGFIEIDVPALNTLRTNQQNRALHLWCEMVAQELNEAGLDIKEFFKGGMDLPWSKESVKEYIWRTGMKFYNYQSTTEMKRGDVDKVWEICNRALSARGIHVPFPSDQIREFNDV